MANLSSKELSALEDQMTHESVLVKKYQHMAQCTCDATLKNKYDQIATMHQSHYNRLYSYLQ